MTLSSRSCTVFRSAKDPADPVLVIREAAELEAALRRALENADADERPGLEIALTIASRTAAVPDTELRRRWVHRTLAGKHLDTGDTVGSVKALREAVPSLTLTTAYQLVQEAGAE